MSTSGGVLSISLSRAWGVEATIPALNTFDAEEGSSSMSVCIFCQIVAGQAPASVVYQDDTVIALLDIAPITPGHLLVLPRAHVPSLAELDDATGAHLFRVARQLTTGIYRSTLASDGITLSLADGEAAGQEVPHLHLHVIPRVRGDGVRLTFKQGNAPSRAALDALAAHLRAASRDA